MEELDWSAETSGVTLNADLEPKTHHQTPMTCTYGYSHFRHFQNLCNRDGITILEIPELYFHFCCHSFESAFFCSKEGGVPILLSI